MPTNAPVPPALNAQQNVIALLSAGLLTTIIDGLFSSILVVAAYGSTVSRLFQGVAATVVGNSAANGGAAMTALGVLIHCGVAFGWSAIFIFGLLRWQPIRRVLASSYGVIKIAVVYGPFVWLVMSLIVIPLLSKPVPITIRWWVQLAGHFPFVGIPIVASARRAMAAVRSEIASAASTP